MSYVGILSKVYVFGGVDIKEGGFLVFLGSQLYFKILVKFNVRKSGRFSDGDYFGLFFLFVLIRFYYDVLGSGKGLQQFQVGEVFSILGLDIYLVVFRQSIRVVEFFEMNSLFCQKVLVY